MKILINGADLLGLIRQIELPHCSALGIPDSAGDHLGLSPEQAFAPSKWLLGRHDRALGPEFPGGKTPIYSCAGCGDFDCGCILVQIDVGPSVVSWSKFEDPRRPAKEDGCDYTRLGPFTFDRAKYEAALVRAPGRARGG